MHKNKFSIGLSLYGNKEYYKKIFEKYSNKIDYLYFSPNLGLKFQSRISIQNFFDNGYEKEMLKILKLAKEYGIKLELAINSNQKITKEDVNLCYLWCKNNNIEIDSIVTFNKLIEYTRFLFGDKIHYICSYNQNLRTYEDLYKISNLFDEVVIGNSFIRDVTAFFILKERGFKIRILLNNGCSHNCLWCSTGGSKHCDSIFESNLKKHSIEELIAKQSVFPYEIDYFYKKIELIDNYKISTRNVPTNFLNIILHNYLDNNFDINVLDDLMSTIILANISKYIKEHFCEINKNEILKIKKELIEKEFSKIKG